LYASVLKEYVNKSVLSREGCYIQFETHSTNNVCEYESLVLGLEIAIRMKIANLIVYGDAELIVKQEKNIYQARHPRMRS
jgi:ribonuclease HI